MLTLTESRESTNYQSWNYIKSRYHGYAGSKVDHVISKELPSTNSGPLGSIELAQYDRTQREK